MESDVIDSPPGVFSHWPFVWDYDVELAKSWTSGHQHRHRPLIKTWLPASGHVIALDGEPVIMYWLYFDPTCSVSYVDWLITKPGQSFYEVTKPAIIYAHHGPTRLAMIEHGASVLVMRTQRGVARHRFEGWYLNDELLVTMSYAYSEEELNG